MLNIKEITPKDIGRRVIYTSGHSEPEEGVLKSYNETFMFVVFHCNGEWENYRDYTGCCTNPRDLKFKYKEK